MLRGNCAGVEFNPSKVEALRTEPKAEGANESNPSGKFGRIKLGPSEPTKPPPGTVASPVVIILDEVKVLALTKDDVIPPPPPTAGKTSTLPKT